MKQRLRVAAQGCARPSLRVALEEPPTVSSSSRPWSTLRAQLLCGDDVYWHELAPLFRGPRA